MQTLTEKLQKANERIRKMEEKNKYVLIAKNEKLAVWTDNVIQYDFSKCNRVVLCFHKQNETNCYFEEITIVDTELYYSFNNGTYYAFLSKNSINIQLSSETDRNYCDVYVQ